MHLLRTDIVNRDDEDGFVPNHSLDFLAQDLMKFVLLEQTLQLVEVSGLVAGLAPHVFLMLKIGYLRVEWSFNMRASNSDEAATTVIAFSQPLVFSN